MWTRRIPTLLILLAGLVFFGAAPGTGTDETPPEIPVTELLEALGCRACHQIRGVGGSLAADLTQVGTRLTRTEIRNLLATNIPTRTGNFMPAYSTLTAAELDQISSYLYHLP